VLQKRVHFPDTQYLIFEGFKIALGTGGMEFRTLTAEAELHHVAARYVEVAGTGGFKSKGVTSISNKDFAKPIYDIVLYNFVSHDTGQWDAVAEDDTHSFSVGHYVKNYWLVDSVAYRSGGDGIQVSHGGNFTSDHIYIGRNVFFKHRENAVDLKQANDVIVSENDMYDFSPTSSASGDCLVIHYSPKRIWVLNNIVHACPLGLVTTDSTETYFIGNLIYNIKHKKEGYNPSSSYSDGTAIHARNSTLQVINNTIVDYDSGIQMPLGFTGSTIVNNVFANRTNAGGFDILIPSGASKVVMDYNLFDSSVPTKIGWDNATARDLTAFRAAFPTKGEHAKTGKVSFSSAASYFPKADSASVNTGTADAAYQTFQTLYGLNIKKDLAGATRPNGSAWDIGAYEYNGTIPPPPPPPPDDPPINPPITPPATTTPPITPPVTPPITPPGNGSGGTGGRSNISDPKTPGASRGSITSDRRPGAPVQVTSATPEELISLLRRLLTILTQIYILLIARQT
jgi:hypothetical protein